MLVNKQAPNKWLDKTSFYVAYAEFTAVLSSYSLSGDFIILAALTLWLHHLNKRTPSQQGENQRSIKGPYIDSAKHLLTQLIGHN